MTEFIDLSHYFEDNMPGFKMKNKDGTVTQYTARIHPFLTHEETGPLFEGKASFEITEITFQTSVGTYIDSPYHRFPQGRDISQIALEEVILPGVVVDVRNRSPGEAVSIDVIPERLLKQHAVLFNFGWDIHWGTDTYYSYPFISKEVIQALCDKEVGLVGVDTVNIDHAADLTRPAHTLFLKNDILIVENLTNLDRLYGKEFRFFAVPLKGKKVAAMPVRAFAEIL
jgi:kynurenine formamidase